MLRAAVMVAALMMAAACAGDPKRDGTVWWYEPLGK